VAQGFCLALNFIDQDLTVTTVLSRSSHCFRRSARPRCLTGAQPQDQRERLTGDGDRQPSGTPSSSPSAMRKLRRRRLMAATCQRLLVTEWLLLLCSRTNARQLQLRRAGAGTTPSPPGRPWPAGADKRGEPPCGPCRRPGPAARKQRRLEGKPSYNLPHLVGCPTPCPVSGFPGVKTCCPVLPV